MVGWANQAAGGAKGSGSDMGLWRLRLGSVIVALAMSCEADSLCSVVADHWLQSVLSTKDDPGFKARGARDKWKKISKKFTTASIYVEFKYFLRKKNQIS